MDTFLEQMRGVSVPQAVESDPGDIKSAHQTGKAAGYGARVERLTVGMTAHEGSLVPAAAQLQTKLRLLDTTLSQCVDREPFITNWIAAMSAFVCDALSKLDQILGPVARFEAKYARL